MSDFEELERKLREAEKGDASPEKVQAAEDQNNKRVALQAGMELTGGIIIGTGIGIGLDTWLDTKPLFIILMFLLGVVTGFYNIFRVMNNMDSSVGFAKAYKEAHKELHPEEKDATTLPDSKDH
ncbi:MAG: AtpZ/AtpI family protein [Alphaproteobacteria bacterium]|nr:AtpZ/AtpI family protein [Alphaproteobacteria bacterium]